MTKHLKLQAQLQFKHAAKVIKVSSKTTKEVFKRHNLRCNKYVSLNTKLQIFMQKTLGVGVWH